MLTKALAFNLLICLLISASLATAQSITPATINIGGATFDNKDYRFDWSIGDGISIETFESNRNLIITTGVLQPFTEKSGTLNFFTFPWSRDELAVFPIPTYNTLELDIKIAEQGLVTAHVLDQAGRMILTSRRYFDGTSNKHKIDLTGLAPGIYYLNVSLGGVGTAPLIRKSSFKIQKL